MGKRMIYLAYPIDNANLSPTLIREINDSKRRLLEDYGTLVVYDPGDAFTVAPSSQVGNEISAINNAAIDASGGVLAWLPQGAKSIGVPMEIARAAMMGKPVAVISDSWSWALAGAGDLVRVFPETHILGATEWLAGVEAPEWANAHETEPMPVFGHPAEIPTREYPDDAGLDLYVSQDTVLPWGQFVDVPCGVRVQLPDWSWGLLTGRSSTFRRRQIEVQTGVIDAGYRGELFAACIWRPRSRESLDPAPYVTVKAGERLAQLIVIPNGTRDVQPVQAEVLSHHERGENGFGSSGT